MPMLKIQGVDVDFPFTPYSCQVDYMSKVIQCLQEKKNGILESPTGTGKTLCLLCATLAWREAFIANQQLQSLQRSANDGMFGGGFGKELKEDLYGAAKGWGDPGEEGLLMEKPKIIYASRTHSQLSQAIQQLKDTSYRPKVCIIGSREQLCIHPEVASQQNNTTMVHMCRAKVGARTCHFYNKVEEKRNEKDFTENILDIEDLVKTGQKHKTCPYYMARELKASADIVFMPYNYLLDPKSRKAHGLELGGSILIFDEAHNVEKMCEESVSFDFTSYDMASCISETSKLLESTVKVDSLNQQFNTESSVSDFKSGELYQLKALFLILEEAIDSIPVSSGGNGITKSGSFIYELLELAKITFETYTQALDLLEKMVSHLTNSPSGVFSKTNGLQKFSDILKIVFSGDSTKGAAGQMAMMSKYYKVHIHVEDFNKKKQRTDLWTSNAKSEKSGKTLSCWCFCPGFTMRDLAGQGVRSIVLTSGTLSPLESFTSEMQIKFPIKLENPHVIEKHQMLVGIVTKGPDGTALNSSYENRFSPDYMQSLGNSIVNYSRIVPNGLLIFFPSYPVMNKCIEVWQQTGISSRISQYKQMFIEPRNKIEFNEAMEEFYQKVNDPNLNGAAFFAVCRGKVSEGLDFADNNGRAVVITGLPFPPRMDAKVNLKMRYLDEAKSIPPKQGLTGRQWYRQQASRAVNQAIGRVIRHKEDYGAIILCDNRFTYSDARAQLPSWVRPYVKIYDSFGLVMRDMIHFFKTTGKMMPKPMIKPKATHSTTDFKVPATRSSSATSAGASFSTTATYSTRGRTVSHQASLVESHVPSLRRPDKSVPEAKLKVMYETSTSSKSSSRFTGLLDALDEHEQKKGTEDDDYNGVNTGETSRYDATMQKRLEEQRKKAMQKRKIVLVKPTVRSNPLNLGGPGSSSGQSRAPSRVDSYRQTWTAEQEPMAASCLVSARESITKVREVLSHDRFGKFCALLKEYKKDMEFATLVAGLADLFIEDPSMHYLFRSFYKFIRPCHKKEYDEVCSNLTGMGCGYKPEDSLPRDVLKKVKDQGSIGQSEKRKRDMDSVQDGRPVKIPMLSDSNPVSSSAPLGSKSKHLDTTTHLNQGKTSHKGSAQSNPAGALGTAVVADTTAQRKGKPPGEKRMTSAKNDIRSYGKVSSASADRGNADSKREGSTRIAGRSGVDDDDQQGKSSGKPAKSDSYWDKKVGNESTASQASPMSISVTEESEAGEFNASLSLFSGESSALDTSIDSVSGTDGSSTGKKKKKKKKRKNPKSSREKDSPSCTERSGESKDKTKSGSSSRHGKLKGKYKTQKDGTDRDPALAEAKSSHSGTTEDKSDTVNLDTSFSTSSPPPTSVCQGSEAGGQASTSKEKENFHGAGSDDDIWDSVSRKTLESVQDGQLFKKHVTMFRTKGGLTCGICKQEAIQPFKAKCQHICCKECWPKYIKEHKKCPQCGQPTKRRHLERVYFPHGHSQRLSNKPSTT